MSKLDISRYTKASQIIPGCLEHKEFCRRKLRPVRICTILSFILIFFVSALPYVVLEKAGIIGYIIGIVLGVFTFVMLSKGCKLWLEEMEDRIKEEYDIPKSFKDI